MTGEEKRSAPPNKDKKCADPDADEDLSTIESISSSTQVMQLVRSIKFASVSD